MSLLLQTSCSKWINIKPTDRISEEVLFDSKEGYLRALNGIYVDFASPDLYGQFLTAGALDIMGQYYVFPTRVIAENYSLAIYDYNQTQVKFGFDRAWSKMYRNILNVNVIIDRLGFQPSEIVPEPYYSLIKGEALAMRGLLHFDVLRMFGPAWTDSEKDLPVMPYYQTVTRDVSPLYSSDEVMKMVLQDLEDARVLLFGVDPIYSGRDATMEDPGGDNTFHLRQYRLNYFAVNALLARAYLWKNDKVTAGQLARETIELVQIPGQEIFPFVLSADAGGSRSRDRIFGSEVIFAVYTINRQTVYNNLFAPSLNSEFRLAPNMGDLVRTRIDAMYDDQNDYRYQIWEPTSHLGLTLLTNQKLFASTIDLTPLPYMLPLIRLSELYLIAAECSTDVQEGLQYVNTIRRHRNALSVNAVDFHALQSHIGGEYKREFICEGQQFFYYKRMRQTLLPDPTSLVGQKTVPLSIYRVPLPESETSQRL